MSELSLPLKQGLPPRQLALQVVVSTLGRLFMSTASRFVYVFAPALSRGLGVPVSAITSLIAVNQATGILSPLFGPLSDRWGYRAMMLIGLGLLSVGMIGAGIFPFYGAILIALLFAGLCKSTFGPAWQAYLGEHVPYNRRGLVVGLGELAWAGSSLIGIPVVGWLIERLGWQAPFLVLGGLTIASAIGLAILIPSSKPHSDVTRPRPNFMAAWSQLRQSRPAVGGMFSTFFLTMANDNLFITLGFFLESFGLSLTALGLAASVIGVAELIGEILTASFSDRFGLKRSIIVGMALTIVAYLALPFLNLNLTWALVGIFLVFLFFEFAIVTGMSIYTEVLPQARATMMSSSVAMAGVGRMIGALIGGLAWLYGGLPLIAIISATLTSVALLFFIWGFRGWQ